MHDRACTRIPLPNLHGKEGVDGSSPSEGSAKAPQNGAFCFARTFTINNVRWVWSRLWSFQVEETYTTTLVPADARLNVAAWRRVGFRAGPALRLALPRASSNDAPLGPDPRKPATAPNTARTPRRRRRPWALSIFSPASAASLTGRSRGVRTRRREEVVRRFQLRVRAMSKSPANVKPSAS
jgi:hypothetical protein